MNIISKFFGHSFWSMGFRPFFIMVIILSILPTATWVLQFTGLLFFNFDPLTPNQWHANEMIFGFLLAAILGFLLTASANWTGTRGIHGKWLFFLFSLFFIARLIFWFTPFEDMWIYILIGSIVPLLLVIHLTNLFIRTNNRRNLIMIAPLLALVGGQLLILSSQYQVGYELAIFSVRFLVVVIAGRVIPFFTRRAIGLEPKWNFPFLDKITIFSVFLLIFEPLYKDMNPAGEYIWLALTFLSFFLNIFRLVNWRFFPSFKVKILFILYIAYMWLPIHFFLSIANYFQWINDIGRASLHSLSYGCMGIMILGIIHRVTLGHTGRVIQASPVSVAGYLLIIGGAFIRVLGPLFDPQAYLLWIKLSGTLWVLAFLLIGIEIIPMLILPRADGKDF